MADLTTLIDAPVLRPKRIWLETLRKSLTYRRTQIGLAITIMILLVALLGPLLSPYEPSAFIGRPFAQPSAEFWLGTDVRGRDVLSRVLNGGLAVVWMSVAAATVGIVLGASIGMLAAYSRGWFAELLMRTMDVFLALPSVIMVLMFVSLLGPQQWLIVLLVGISHMPQVARVMQGVASDIARRDFILFAEALNVPRWKILFREILPNIMTPLMVEYGIRIVWSIAGIAALSVMGYGIQPPDADWGLLINENRGRLATRPLPVLAPALLIALFALGVNLMAEGLSATISGVARKTGAR
jgi:peptide/nickel transport system permease protein